MVMGVTAVVYTQVLFLEYTCPKCGSCVTLDVDDDKVMTSDGEELCDVSEIDDVYVDKEFQCKHCDETLRLTGSST